MTTALKDLLSRAGWTALQTAAALLLADGAAQGITHISIPEYKAAGVTALAAALSAGKTVVVNHLSTHQSLKSQVATLRAVLATLAPPPAPPAA